MRPKLEHVRLLIISTTIFVVSLLISGCITVPEQTQIVRIGPDENHSVSASSCDIEKIQFTTDKSRVRAYELDANNITVLNWNIYKGQKKNWAKDFSQLSDDSDLVIIQEARLTSAAKNTFKQQNINWALSTGFYLNEEANGVLTGSKIKPVTSCGLRTTEPFLRLPKTALINKYNISGTDEKLLVANIHSINFTLGTEVYKSQIDALKAAIIQHMGPVIVAGDFNNWSNSRKKIIDQMVTDLSLKAVTYKNKNRVTIFGNEVDHVFYRGLVSVKSEAKQVTSSNHNPIKVTFRVPVEQNVAMH